MNWDFIYKTVSILTGFGIGYLFGGWSVLLQILLTFVVIDYISGLLAAGIEGKLSSSVGFKGIAKKIMIFVLVAVGHLIDKAVGQGHMILDAIVFFYLGMELLSITENAGRAGVPVPSQIKNAVEILKSKGGGN